MPHWVHVGVLVAAAVRVILPSAPTVAQTVSDPATSAVRIVYGETENPVHQAILARLKKRRVLEDMRDFLSPLRLPAPLTIKTMSCNGITNAWYSNSTNTITYCYEMIDFMRRSAPSATTEEGLTPEDAVVGSFVDIMLHELSHAVFDVLKIPVFGREEDAADQLAAFILLQFGNDVARRTITATAYFWWKLSGDGKAGDDDFANAHGLARQRFFNVLCIAYGAQRDLFTDFVQKGLLPRSRADGCGYEYQQIRYAYLQLIAPHVDPEMQKIVQGREWLKSESAQ